MRASDSGTTPEPRRAAVEQALAERIRDLNRSLALLTEVGDALSRRADAVLAFHGDHVVLGDLAPVLYALETNARRWRQQVAHERAQRVAVHSCRPLDAAVLREIPLLADRLLFALDPIEVAEGVVKQRATLERLRDLRDATAAARDERVARDGGAA